MHNTTPRCEQKEKKERGAAAHAQYSEQTSSLFSVLCSIIIFVQLALLSLNLLS